MKMHSIVLRRKIAFCATNPLSVSVMNGSSSGLLYYRNSAATWYQQYRLLSTTPPSTTPPPSNKPTLFSRLKGYVQQSRQMAIQYFNGAKLLRENATKTFQLQKQILDNPSLTLSRADHLLISQTESDIRKMVPFFIVLLIIPEALPFLVIYRPNFIPSTCWSQEQRDARRVKLDGMRPALARAVLAQTSVTNAANSTILKLANEQPQLFELKNLSSEHLKTISTYYGIPTLAPDFIVRERLYKHLEFLRKDDEHLAREGIDSLSNDLINEAAHSRGIITADKSIQDIKNDMEEWISLHLQEKSSSTTQEPPVSDENVLIVEKDVGRVADQLNSYVKEQLRQHLQTVDEEIKPKKQYAHPSLFVVANQLSKVL